MNTTNVFDDPQSSMSALLRPPDDFERFYQGVARTTPLAFVQADNQGRYSSLDARAGSPEYSEFLLNYIPAPIGATMILLIPRARYLVGGEPAEGVYTYEIRWRLRNVRDHNLAQRIGNPNVPYSMRVLHGAPEDDAAQRLLLPAFTSEAIVPAAAGGGLLPIVSGGAADPQVGYATQGLYVPATVGGETFAHAPNAYFTPIQRRVLGNEVSIVAYRAADPSTWDFSDTDGGISNVYGTNQAGTAHPVFENIGMQLIFVAGSAAL